MGPRRGAQAFARGPDAAARVVRRVARPRGLRDVGARSRRRRIRSRGRGRRGAPRRRGSAARRAAGFERRERPDVVPALRIIQRDRRRGRARRRRRGGQDRAARRPVGGPARRDGVRGRGMLKSDGRRLHAPRERPWQRREGPLAPYITSRALRAAMLTDAGAARRAARRVRLGDGRHERGARRDPAIGRAHLAPVLLRVPVAEGAADARRGREPLLRGGRVPLRHRRGGAAEDDRNGHGPRRPVLSAVRRTRGPRRGGLRGRRRRGRQGLRRRLFYCFIARPRLRRGAGGDARLPAVARDEAADLLVDRSRAHQGAGADGPGSAGRDCDGARVPHGDGWRGSFGGVFRRRRA
mmetsp:Transcript_9574/g.29048  ORF Transcript_9574/g.29048 Transcript_9574/m.29048 type:complete len:353 (+) Transcript_9574:310-1368(+)